jgi:predicted metal-dependent hydrolase
MKYVSSILLDGAEVPVEVIIERRINTRYGITRRGVNLRLPAGSPPEYIQQQLSALQEWVNRQVQEKPALRAYFHKKQYQTGDLLRVGERSYKLEVSVSDRASHSARLVGDTICLNLSARGSEAHRHKSAKTLLSRVVADDFYPYIVDRVLTLNRETFNQPIYGISLKYNHSNWGSCSRRNNINLSTRLLFAPQSVQDYVIVHELAHLVEMNHSDRFWALVETHLPDYREQERWLKVNGATCDF